MMPLSIFSLIATRWPLTTVDSVEQSAHRHLAHLLLRQSKQVASLEEFISRAQHVGRLQDVCTRGRQIPLQSISKLRAARNVCLVHLGQHQAAVGAACKATSTRTCKERNASSTQRSSGWRRSARLIVNPDEHGLVDNGPEE